MLSTHIQNASLIQKLFDACRVYHVCYFNHMTLQQKRFFQICVFREYGTYYEIKIFLIIWEFSIGSQLTKAAFIQNVVHCHFLLPKLRAERRNYGSFIIFLKYFLLKKHG